MTKLWISTSAAMHSHVDSPAHDHGRFVLSAQNRHVSRSASFPKRTDDSSGFPFPFNDPLIIALVAAAAIITLCIPIVTLLVCRYGRRRKRRADSVQSSSFPRHNWEKQPFPTLARLETESTGDVHAGNSHLPSSDSSNTSLLFPFIDDSGRPTYTSATTIRSQSHPDGAFANSNGHPTSLPLATKHLSHSSTTDSVNLRSLARDLASFYSASSYYSVPGPEPPEPQDKSTISRPESALQQPLAGMTHLNPQKPHRPGMI